MAYGNPRGRVPKPRHKPRREFASPNQDASGSVLPAKLNCIPPRFTNRDARVEADASNDGTPHAKANDKRTLLFGTITEFDAHNFRWHNFLIL
jgi:hypothetical protein